MKTRNKSVNVAAKNRTRAAVQKPMPSLPKFPSEVQLKTLHYGSGLFSRIWNWFRERQAARATSKRLHVAASVSLGEKRFIAVIQVDGQQFLVGGGATNVALLAQVAANEPLNSVLENAMSAPKEEPARRVRRRVATPLPEKFSGYASRGKASPKTVVAERKRPTKRAEPHMTTPLAKQLKANDSFSRVLHETIADPKKRTVKRVTPQPSTPLAEQLRADDFLDALPEDTVDISKKPPVRALSLQATTPQTEQLRERA
jgi:flagellar biogenesis protein FliO